MNFNFDKKSLIIGIAAGFLAAVLVISIALIVDKNHQLQQNNLKLKQQLQSINDIPLIKTKERTFDSSKEIVYEEAMPEPAEVEHMQNNPIESIEPAKGTEEFLANKDLPLYVKNRQKFTIDPNKKQIAIVIDDVGVNHDGSMYSAEQLPVEITFAYLPYGNSTQKLIKQEFNKTREALLHLPTEPISSIDPGPNALYANMSAEKITEVTEYNVNQLIDYIVGANNHMGSKFTANQADMEAALKVIDENKLFFIDSFTTAKTKVTEARNKVAPNMPLLKRNIFLDHKRTDEFLTMQLKKVEKIANSKGYAIAIGHPHKLTTDNLIKWIKQLDTTKYQLVPITAILEKTGQLK